MATPPFFSIVTVTRQDAWSLTKTMRSVFEQSCQDLEYLVVDGGSDDGTRELVAFWSKAGLVDRWVSEPDTGVYNAMNKGLRMAKGRFVLFMNAGDVFASADVLARVRDLLDGGGTPDGVLGWGELGGQVWASWTESEAFRMSSLGFCHQSLYVRRELLLAHPFDERPGRTDSDTAQLASLYADGARIVIVPEVLAVRGTEPGISANLEKTKASILQTLKESYPGIPEAWPEEVVAFRRSAAAPGRILQMLEHATGAWRTHLAMMVLDTLFLRQSAALPEPEAMQLLERARAVLVQADPADGRAQVERLIAAQLHRAQLASKRNEAATALRREIATFGEQESLRLAKLAAPASGEGHAVADLVVSLTSFPARLSTVHFVVRSLLAQTVRPREIQLWLGRDEIPRRSYLPSQLLELERQGLRICFVDRTHHQYDKFHHNADTNRTTPLVIVDDDVIYPPETIARLVAGHRAHPQAVIANRCHRAEVTEDATFAPYADWQREVQAPEPVVWLFPTGAGGVLYPPGFMTDGPAADPVAALRQAPYADDVWLKACALARGIPTFATDASAPGRWYLRYTPTMRAGALHATNVDRGLNDLQLAAAARWLSEVRPGWHREFVGEEVLA